MERNSGEKKRRNLAPKPSFSTGVENEKKFLPVTRFGVSRTASVHSPDTPPQQIDPIARLPLQHKVRLRQRELTVTTVTSYDKLNTLTRCDMCGHAHARYPRTSNQQPSKTNLFGSFVSKHQDPRWTSLEDAPRRLHNLTLSREVKTDSPRPREVTGCAPARPSTPARTQPSRDGHLATGSKCSAHDQRV